MKITAMPVAAAQDSKITRTAHPHVAVLCGGAPARAINMREDEYATIAVPWAVSRRRVEPMWVVVDGNCSKTAALSV